MTPFHGAKAVFKIQDAGGSLQDLSAYTNHVTLSGTKTADESEALGATAKSYIGGYADAKIHLDGIMDAQVETVLRGLMVLQYATARRNFEYGPQGQATGKIQITGQCVLITYEIITKHDDSAHWMAEIQVSGNITSGVY